jgi:hypothetical protein
MNPNLPPKLHRAACVTRDLLLAVALALGTASAAAQSLQISAPLELHTSASGSAVLDLVEGRKSVAVISVPYGQALAAARRQASAAGRRFQPPPDLQIHAIDDAKGAAPRLAVATLGAPSDEALQIIDFLRTRGARATVAER